jgi:hypothetical protein
MYNTQMVVGFGLCCSVLMASSFPNFYVLSWTLGWFMYSWTYLWSPGITGRRAVDKRYLLSVFDLATSYFGLNLYRAHDKPLPTANGEKYILGYHPHGLMPFACCWATSNSKWAALFPELSPAYLTASYVLPFNHLLLFVCFDGPFELIAGRITHVIPLMRDIGQWLGGFEVTLQGFMSALHQRKSVIIVPGMSTSNTTPSYFTAPPIAPIYNTCRWTG